MLYVELYRHDLTKRPTPPLHKLNTATLNTYKLQVAQKCEEILKLQQSPIFLVPSENPENKNELVQIILHHHYVYRNYLLHCMNKKAIDLIQLISHCPILSYLTGLFVPYSCGIRVAAIARLSIAHSSLPRRIRI